MATQANSHNENYTMRASHEWATRPPDQRFWSVSDGWEAANRHYQQRVEVIKPLRQLAVIDSGGDLMLYGGKEPARFTNYSFDQFTQLAGVGRHKELFTRTPAHIVAPVLNHHMAVAADRDGDRKLNLLLFRNGDLSLRAATSERYSRIWNHQVFEWLMDLGDDWTPPPAFATSTLDQKSGKLVAPQDTRLATAEDVAKWSRIGVGRNISVGTEIAPAGVYCSDRDMFTFLINVNRTIDPKTGGGEPMSRGFFVKNSEVGDARLSITMFYFSYICGNHIVWGSRLVGEVSVVHVGEAYRKFSDGRRAVIEAVEDSERNDVARISAAKGLLLGANEGELVEFFTKEEILSAKQTKEVYAMAVKHSDDHGDPRSAWGMAAGMTRVSQQTAFANERNQMDRAAAMVLDVAFERVG
jgi:hypothetical protein